MGTKASVADLNSTGPSLPVSDSRPAAVSLLGATSWTTGCLGSEGHPPGLAGPGWAAWLWLVGPGWTGWLWLADHCEAWQWAALAAGESWPRDPLMGREGGGWERRGWRLRWPGGTRRPGGGWLNITGANPATKQTREGSSLLQDFSQACWSVKDG